MSTALYRRMFVLVAITVAMVLPASPALADVPSGLTLGASLTVVAVVGLVGLAVLVGVGVLLVKVIVHARRSADADKAEPPAETPS